MNSRTHSSITVSPRSEPQKLFCFLAIFCRKNDVGAKPSSVEPPRIGSGQSNLKITSIKPDIYSDKDAPIFFRFVSERCGFLSAMMPMQPRCAKKTADEDSLRAVIIDQAMNLGNLSMAETSDIPYHVLEATDQQHLRLATLKASNDQIRFAWVSLTTPIHQRRVDL